LSPRQGLARLVDFDLPHHWSGSQPRYRPQIPKVLPVPAQAIELFIVVSFVHLSRITPRIHNTEFPHPTAAAVTYPPASAPRCSATRSEHRPSDPPCPTTLAPSSPRHLAVQRSRMQAPRLAITTQPYQCGPSPQGFHEIGNDGCKKTWLFT
jgi:hypothetical protein